MALGQIRRIDPARRLTVLALEDGREVTVTIHPDANIEVIEPATTGTMGGRLEDLQVGYWVEAALEEQGNARWKACPPGNAQCRNGGETIGPGYWKQDERGAMAFAVAKYMKNHEYKITDYAWDWQDMVEGHSAHLNTQDGRRTLVYVAMHERKLYILEASVPEAYPEPGLFQQSLGWLDKDGNRIRYTETIYSNSYHGLGVYPKPAHRVSGGGQ